MLNLEGTGLIGVPGTAERVFAALRTAQVSVVMISQGSSEHSICCVVKQHELSVHAMRCCRHLRTNSRLARCSACS